MPNLTVTTQVSAAHDADGALKSPDWKRSVSAVVEDVLSDRVTLLPGESRSFFSEAHNTLVVPTAVPPTFAFQDHPFKTGIVQVLSAGVATGLVTAVAVPATNYTVTSNGDGTINLTGVTANVGDTIYLAGSMYGDAGPWNTANQGFWVVKAKLAGGVLWLRRADGELASNGATETVAATDAKQIQKATSASLVRYAYILGAGYSGVWEVLEVTVDWFAIKAPNRAGINQSGVLLERLALVGGYACYHRVEADRQVKVSIGEGGTTLADQVLAPVTEGDSRAIGWLEGRSFVTDLAVLNLSDQPAVVTVFVAFPKAQ